MTRAPLGRWWMRWKCRPTASGTPARVEALLRRSPPHPSPSPVAPPRLADLRVGQLLIEPGRRRATLARESLVLTPTEFRLLTALAAHAESVLTRDRLVQEVWGYADASNSRTVDVHIRRLRIKLADRRAPAPSIVSVRGRGYRLTADDAATSAA